VHVLKLLNSNMGRWTMGMMLLYGLTAVSCTRQENQSVPSAPVAPASLASLLDIAPDGLARVDIARMNLLCAEGLSGTEQVDVAASLAVVDQMAARVRLETERHSYRFRQQPAEFEHSEGFFRMTMLMVVLAEDFRVHYAPEKMVSAAQARRGDGFFANAADVFLPGLTETARRGTRPDRVAPLRIQAI